MLLIVQHNMLLFWILYPAPVMLVLVTKHLRVLSTGLKEIMFY